MGCGTGGLGVWVYGVLLVHSNLFGSNRHSRRHYVTGTLLCPDHVLFFR